MIRDAEPKSIIISPTIDTYRGTINRRSRICYSCPVEPFCDPSSWTESDHKITVRGKLSGTKDCILPLFALRTSARLTLNALTKVAFPGESSRWRSLQAKLNHLERGKRKAIPPDLGRFAIPIAERLGLAVTEIYDQLAALKSNHSKSF